ncbi:hypothetical protein M3Y14_16820 [Bacillus thuringiensis]|uniref:Uncharacterized protein n=1 Tax=Bacillus cereus HuA4-10 TaxID=1053206 RepID=J8AJR3_BACCE|nr:hypothetical protein IGC_02132 [Bacillus cereus HuA4-10]UYX50234.1 hypothetical protein M3Y14_16820 [Bacillus thuringiensis]
MPRTLRETALGGIVYNMVHQVSGSFLRMVYILKPKKRRKNRIQGGFII